MAPHSSILECDSGRHSHRRVLYGLILAAVLLRIAIAAVSIGTDDARLFYTFAVELHRFGIVQTYGLDGLFNHPPIVAAWIELAASLAEKVPHPFGAFHAFSFIFKLPIIAAEMLGVWLVWRIWNARSGPDRAAKASLAAAWSACGILLSAYHCNTDPIYAVLCLAAVYFMEEKKAFLLAGLALGAAINVKIVPVLLIPGLLLSCRSIRDARRFVAGLTICVLPFLRVLWSEAPSFTHNALAYNSSINNWGISALLLAGQLARGLHESTSPSVEVYHEFGRYILFALIGAWAIVARLLNRWTRYEIAAVTFGIFLVFTPGFGVQYLVMIVPLLFAIRVGAAVVYSTAAGVFAGALYVMHLQPGTFPLQSALGRYPVPESILGLIAWAILVIFLFATLRRRSAPALDDAAAGQPSATSYTSARAA